MKLTNNTKVLFEIGIAFTEGEARALDGLTGYDMDAFLRVFYEHLGKSYLQPHEAHLRTLFEKLRAELRPALSKVDELRKHLNPMRVRKHGGSTNE